MSRRGEGVEVSLLGRFSVSIDGRRVDASAWTSRRAKELVQLLALAPGHALVSDQALEALWPHLAPRAAAANLRKAAHHARQALGAPGAVELRAGSARLFPDRAVATDVERFEAAARDALSGADPEACASVAASYPGDLLPDALYEDWTTGPRERLRATQVDLLRGAKDWRAVVELDPVDELAYQALMREALGRGTRSEAIRWYGRLRTELAEQLGVVPDPASEDLYASCLTDLAPRPAACVGRDAELARDRAVLHDAEAGGSRILLVRGPAGIGKTTYCRELARQAEGDGWTIVWFDASEILAAYGPVSARLEQVLADDPELLDGLGEPTRAALAPLTPLVGNATFDGPIGRHQVVGALRRVLVAVSRGAPILAVLDDAHAADDATVDALVQLASSGVGIVVVFAARPTTVGSPLERAIARLARSSRLAVTELAPLDHADAAAVARSATDADLPDAMVDRIVAAADGNPFIAVELARRGATGEDDLDAGLSQALTGRFVDLEDGTVEVLQRLAVVGEDLDTDTVVALTGGDEARAFTVLDEVLEAGVLTVVEARYRFVHDLVRRALVDGVAPHDQLAVHRDAARRLAAGGAQPAVVAHHWLAGGRPAEAAPFLLVAAQQAMGMGAFADAVGHLDALLAHDPDGAPALQLRAEALDVLGDVRALAAYDDAIAVADAVDVGDLRAKRALAQLKQGDPTGALRALEGVIPRSVDGRLAEALTFSGAAALGFVDPETGTAKSAECRRAAIEAGDAAAIVVASWSQAAAAHARGELRESVLADLRDTSHLPHLATRVFDGQLCVTQRLLYGSRPYDDVIEFADGLVAEARRLGAARGHAFGVLLRGEAELLSGRLDEAEQHLGEGARLHRAIGGARGEALAIQRLAELAHQRGEPARATSLLDEALDLARSTDIGFHLLDRIYGTRITLAQDPAGGLSALEEAEDSVRGVLETCPGCRITFAMPAVIAAARGGDLERAAEYEQAAEFLAEVVMRLPAWSAALEEARGHIARARGDERGATDRFAGAARGFRAAEHPLDAARCAVLAGR